MLRIVHPPREGQPTDPPVRRRGSRSPALMLTVAEGARVRAAIKNTARAYGSLECLAAVIGVPRAALSKKHRPGAALALAVARAAGVQLESILRGDITEAGRCRACGARVASSSSRSAAGGA